MRSLCPTPGRNSTSWIMSSSFEKKHICGFWPCLYLVGSRIYWIRRQSLMPWRNVSTSGGAPGRLLSYFQPISLILKSPHRIKQGGFVLTASFIQAGAVSFVSRNAPSADYLYTVDEGMNQSAPSSSEFPALSLVDVEGDFSMNRSFT